MVVGVDVTGDREGGETRAFISTAWNVASICSWRPGGICSTALVLVPGLLPCANALYPSLFYCQQNNNPKYCTHYTQTFFQKNGLNCWLLPLRALTWTVSRTCGGPLKECLRTGIGCCMSSCYMEKHSYKTWTPACFQWKSTDVRKRKRERERERERQTDRQTDGQTERERDRERERERQRERQRERWRLDRFSACVMFRSV